MRPLKSEINVTPLVDVVLVLLIVFMVVVPMLQKEHPVNVPVSAHPDTQSDRPAPVVIVLTARESRDRGAVWVDSRSFPRAELPAWLRELRQRAPNALLRVKADARLTYGEVREVMVQVRDAGFPNVALVSSRKEGA